MSSNADEMAPLADMFHKHRPRLLAMLERRLDPSLQTRVDARDVLAEAFLAGRRKYEDFRRNETLTEYAWLYRITLDALIEICRREGRDKRDWKRDAPWPEQSSIQMGLGLVDPKTSPSQSAAKHELRENMRGVLRLLKHNDQEILWMRHSDELAFKEIASVLEIKESAAKLRYRRALGRLKELWKKLNPDEESRA